MNAVTTLKTKAGRPSLVAQAPPPAVPVTLQKAAPGGGARRTNTGEGACATTRSIAALPRVSPWLLRWFAGYTARYLRRHFSHVWLAGEVPNLDGRPAIVFANHASWWDPLICLHLNRRFFAERPSFAPIDAAALQRYRMLGRMGFFPVEQDSPRGAVQFLRAGQAILARPDAMLWLTPQGEFQDARVRPVRFKPGLAKLIERLDHEVALVPLAIDYFHGVERLPEVAARFGEPISVAAEVTRRTRSDLPPRHLGGYADYAQHLESALAQTQDQLARDVMERSGRPMTSLLSGQPGIGGIYDLWRGLTSRLRGQRFVAGHGDLIR